MQASGSSLALTKKLTRQLEDEGYTEKERQGRSYYVRLTPKGQDRQAAFLSSPTPPPSPSSPSHPHIPRTGIVLRSRTPKDEWSRLMREVKDRGLQTAFLPPNVPVYVEIEGELCAVTPRD